MLKIKNILYLNTYLYTSGNLNIVFVEFLWCTNVHTLSQNMTFKAYLAYQYQHIDRPMIYQGLWKVWAKRVKAGEPVSVLERKLEAMYMKNLMTKSSRGIRANSRRYGISRSTVRKYFKK